MAEDSSSNLATAGQTASLPLGANTFQLRRAVHGTFTKEFAFNHAKDQAPVAGFALIMHAHQTISRWLPRLSCHSSKSLRGYFVTSITLSNSVKSRSTPALRRQLY